MNQPDGKDYAVNYIMKECSETTLNKISSVPETAKFVSYDVVIKEIKKQFNINQSKEMTKKKTKEMKEKEIG